MSRSPRSPGQPPQDSVSSARFDQPEAPGRRKCWQSLASLTAALIAPQLACSRPQESNAPVALPPADSKPEGSVAVSTPESTPATEDKFGKLLPQRRLGANGPWVTMLGLGGAHITDVDEATSQEILETAIEQGVRFFDTAAMYGNGESEKRFGRFLVPRYRDVAFIMTKSHVRTGAGALAQLEASLQHMRIDHVDLWQIHDIQSPEDVNNRVRDGVIDAFVQAQQQGKTRYIGFTGHTSYTAHHRMLEVLAERGVQVTTAQMPINVVDVHYESFALNVVPRCVEAGIGVLAMKTLAFGRILGRKLGWARNDAVLHNIVPDALSLDEALGFVWSLPTSVLISGMTSRTEVESNAAIARRTAALSEAERSRLVEAARPFAGPGVEFYKA